jgi:hypothetical protein
MRVLATFKDLRFEIECDLSDENFEALLKELKLIGVKVDISDKLEKFYDETVICNSNHWADEDTWEDVLGIIKHMINESISI